MEEQKLNFKIWLQEMAATGIVFNPKIKVKKHSDWNYEGAAGRSGVCPKEFPIGYKGKK